MRKIIYVSLILLLLVPGSGTGFRSSDFQKNTQSLEVLAPGNFSIDVPSNASVVRAEMDICPVPIDNNGAGTLSNPVLKINDMVVWAFNGTGFGPFGRQCLFSDGSAAKTFTFGENGGCGETYIRLPKGADIEQALMDVDCAGDSWGWTDSPMGGPGEGAHFGYSIARVGDVNGDGYADFLIGAPFYSMPGKDQVGMACLYLGGPGFCGVPALVLTGSEAGERFGFSLAGGSDFNGDGYDDFFIGAPGGIYQNGEGSICVPGKVFLYLGGPSVDGIPDLTFQEPSAPYDFGYSINSRGDLNNDGFGDLLVCSPYDTSVWWTGMVYEYLGSDIPDNRSDGAVYNHDDSILAYTVEAAGDVNRDGYDDFLVMYQEAPPRGRCTGIIPELYWRAALFFGGDYGNSRKLIFSQDASDPAYSFASAGDLNGDGFDDLILGGVWSQTTMPCPGLASIYLGGQQMDATADIIILPGPMAGGKVLEAAGAGDVNGDGYDDAILGVGFGPLTEPSAPGAACVYFGGPEPDTAPDLVFHGTKASEIFGGVVAGAGDVNGDGRDEFLVAAAGDDSSGPGSGTINLFSLGYGLPGPRLAIGSVPFWEPEALLRAHGMPVDIKSGLAEYLHTAPVTGTDTFGNEYVDVPISASAGGGGDLTLSNIRIRYNCTARVADFSAAANDYLDSLRRECPEASSITLNIECASPALFNISNLDLEYGYRPSLLRPIPDVTLDAGSSNSSLIDLWNYFQDAADPMSNLEFEVLEATNSDAVNVEVVFNRYLAAKAVTGRASSNWTGEVTAIVGCRDENGYLKRSNEFKIIVREVQDPVVITSAAPTQACYGTEYTYGVVAKDATGDALCYCLLERPDGMTIDPTNGEIGWFSQTRGNFDVHVMVTNGKDRAFQNFTIDVWKNTLPVIQSEPPVKAIAGFQYEYDVMASDAEGDQLSFYIRTAAQGMSIDSSTGCIIWTPRQDQLGSYPVSIIISDGMGDRAEQDFSVDVQDNRPGCRIMDPAEGAIVNGTFVFRGESGGVIPAVWVEASVDGGNWLLANGTDRWDFALNTSILANGGHTFQARAFNGVYSEVVQVNFVVMNRQSHVKMEHHTEGVAFLPQLVFLALIAAGVILWRKGSAGSQTGRS